MERLGQLSVGSERIEIDSIWNKLFLNNMGKNKGRKSIYTVEM